MAKKSFNKPKGRGSKTNTAPKTPKNGVKDVEGKTDGYVTNRTGSEFTTKQCNNPNDVSWLTPTDQMVRDVANVSFSNYVGATMVVTDVADDPVNNRAVPGLLTVEYVPSFGTSRDETSAINVGARVLYDAVRHAIRASTNNYGTSDLTLRNLGVLSCHAALEEIKRIYGVLMKYNPQNRYYPRAIVESMGYDFDDMRDNVANLRAFINLCAYELSQLPVPALYDAWKTWELLNSHVFADNVGPKAQLYMFTPLGAWQYNEKGGAGKLEFIAKPYAMDGHIVPGSITFAEMKVWFRSLMTVLINSQDIKDMGGDQITAFGTGKMLYAKQIPENFETPFMYSEEIISQIENSSVLPFNSGVPGITQRYGIDKDELFWDPIWRREQFDSEADFQYARFNKVLNVYGDTQPSPQEIMTITRYSNTLKVSPVDPDAYYLPACDVVIPSRYTIAVFERVTDSETHEMQISYHHYTNTAQIVAIPPEYQSEELNFEAFYAMVDITKFRRHPKVLLCEFRPLGPSYDPAGEGDLHVQGLIGDLDNYGVVTLDTLSNIHGTAIVAQVQPR